MIDLTSISKTSDVSQADMSFYDTLTTRAANILSVQFGSLEYAPDFGIDLAYFLTESVKFQNEGFKSYCVQLLATYGISVTSVDEVIKTLMSEVTFNIPADETTDGLLAR